jgi:shikimate dehydrogenase
VGHPIAHSRSPRIHGYWLKRYGIAGSYEPVDVAPDDFPGFVSGLRAQGLSAAMSPCRIRKAFRLVEWRDEAAEEIGAVNTLWFEGGRLWGRTRTYGFAANLDQRAPGWDQAGTALVLGAGGVTRHRPCAEGAGI